MLCRRDIPTPLEMLTAQCEGRRYVTLMTAAEDQSRRFGRHDGALEFLLHDLEHAHKYFGDAELARAQRRFFQLLHARLPLWPAFDDEFQSSLDYLASDMNSHPLHMLKYLKAIWLNAFKRSGQALEAYEDFCREQFVAWNLPLAPACKLNQPGHEGPADHLLLTEFYLSP